LKRLTISFVAAFAAVLIAAGVSPACKSARPDPRAVWVEALLTKRISAEEPGAAVLVVRKGKAVFASGRGVRDLRAKRPIDARTNFRLASVSKAFTAAAVVLAVRDGRLGYDTPLTELFPDFPEYGRAITVRHLLQHTSGLPDYEDLMTAPDPALPVEQAQIRDEEVLDLLKRQGAGTFPPGERWVYSNSGYVLLGLIAAKVSDRPFPDLLRERIFGPLRMKRSVAFVRGRNEVPRRAYGHSRRDGSWVETDQSPTSATLGDGGVYSSLADLEKWDAALRNRSLLDAKELERVRTPADLSATGPDGIPAAYGFGWFLSPWRGHARMWHHGETSGFRTTIQRFVDDDLTVIVLCNRTDIDAPALALEVAEAYLAPRPTGG
jgi:CubicO group peptidase (beta-lactamase class C family)